MSPLERKLLASENKASGSGSSRKSICPPMATATTNKRAAVHRSHLSRPTGSLLPLPLSRS